MENRTNTQGASGQCDTSAIQEVMVIGRLSQQINPQKKKINLKFKKR